MINRKERKEHKDFPLSVILRSLCSLRLKEWWSARISRQQEIGKSIAAKADFEFLYDEPTPPSSASSAASRSSRPA